MRTTYLIAAALVLAIEVVIATFVHDSLVRPFAGDALAVFLVYLTLRGATPLGAVASAGVAFGIAVAIEFSQLFHLLHGLGLDHDRIARIVLGGTFDPRDFAAYAAGAGGALLWEILRRGAKGSDATT